jgi:hypothetical protein
MIWKSIMIPSTSRGEGANPTVVPSSKIAWEFLSQYPKEVDES